MSENRVIRRIFGTKKEEVIEGWKKLQEEQVKHLYSLRNIITVIKKMKDKISEVYSTHERYGI
jgi:hypothetical protein